MSFMQGRVERPSNIPQTVTYGAPLFISHIESFSMTTEEPHPHKKTVPLWKTVRPRSSNIQYSPIYKEMKCLIFVCVCVCVRMCICACL